MKDDGRLKSLGVLLVMISVIVGFFSMFLKREPLLVRPTSRDHHVLAPTAAASASSANAATSVLAPASSTGTAP